jgi:hypothetical protein
MKKSSYARYAITFLDAIGQSIMVVVGAESKKEAIEKFKQWPRKFTAEQLKEIRKI